jgi:hypothetical protein
MEQFKYLETPATNHNLIQEKIKWRLNSSNVCFHSVQSLLSSRLLTKNVKITLYTTTVLAVVLYGCETWSLTLREEHRLRVFEVRALRRIFGLKRSEVVGRWRELLHTLYASPNVIGLVKHDDMGGARSTNGGEEEECIYMLLVRKSEGNRPLGRKRRRWVDNIEIDLGEIRCRDEECTDRPQDRDQRRAVVNTVMNLGVL